MHQCISTSDIVAARRSHSSPTLEREDPSPLLDLQQKERIMFERYSCFTFFDEIDQMIGEELEKADAIPCQQDQGSVANNEKEQENKTVIAEQKLQENSPNSESQGCKVPNFKHRVSFLDDERRRFKNISIEPFNKKQQHSGHKAIIDLKFETFLQDVKQGSIPDFGFVEDLKFGESKPGWHLFTGLISGYPRHQKLTQFIEEETRRKQAIEEIICRSPWRKRRQLYERLNEERKRLRGKQQQLYSLHQQPSLLLSLRTADSQKFDLNFDRSFLQKKELKYDQFSKEKKLFQKYEGMLNELEIIKENIKEEKMLHQKIKNGQINTLVPSQHLKPPQGSSPSKDRERRQGKLITLRQYTMRAMNEMGCEKQLLSLIERAQFSKKDQAGSQLRVIKIINEYVANLKKVFPLDQVYEKVKILQAQGEEKGITIETFQTELQNIKQEYERSNFRVQEEDEEDSSRRGTLKPSLEEMQMTLQSRMKQHFTQSQNVSPKRLKVIPVKPVTINKANVKGKKAQMSKLLQNMTLSLQQKEKDPPLEKINLINNVLATLNSKETSLPKPLKDQMGNFRMDGLVPEIEQILAVQATLEETQNLSLLEEPEPPKIKLYSPYSTTNGFLKQRAISNSRSPNRESESGKIDLKKYFVKCQPSKRANSSLRTMQDLRSPLAVGSDSKEALLKLEPKGDPTLDKKLKALQRERFMKMEEMSKSVMEKKEDPGKHLHQEVSQMRLHMKNLSGGYQKLPQLHLERDFLPGIPNLADLSFDYSGSSNQVLANPQHVGAYRKSIFKQPPTKPLEQIQQMARKSFNPTNMDRFGKRKGSEYPTKSTQPFTNDSNGTISLCTIQVQSPKNSNKGNEMRKFEKKDKFSLKFPSEVVTVKSMQRDNTQADNNTLTTLPVPTQKRQTCDLVTYPELHNPLIPP